MFEFTTVIQSFLNDISRKWNTYSEEEKQKFCIDIGGYRNYEYVRKLMDNWTY